MIKNQITLHIQVKNIHDKYKWSMKTQRKLKRMNRNLIERNRKTGYFYCLLIT